MKKSMRRNAKARKAAVTVVFYGVAMFFANSAIDSMMAMTPEEFWGMFEAKKMTFYNTATASTMTQEELLTPDESIDQSPAVSFPYEAKLTAYNSVPEQTDGDPCIAADGTDICRFDGCVVAQNGVKFGTKIEIEGVGVCEVHDRKNSRYGSEWIDIYFGGAEKVDSANEFGKRDGKYRIIAEK